LASPSSSPLACGNRLFSGLAGRGAAVDFVLRPGPVTLIGFTPIGDRFRLIAAHAEVLANAPPQLGVPRGYIRFTNGARDGFDWWCEAGANHHLALTPGYHCGSIAAFAELHDLELRLLE
jgi:L-arabinose isomerase